MPHLSEYAVNHWPYVAALVAMLIVLAVSEFRHATRSHAAISPGEAVRLLNGGALALDLRTPDEYKAGHIANARQIPGTAIADGAENLMKLKEKTVITYCETGMTGGAAARQLGRLGFKQAYNLRGGLAAWRQENLPLTRS